MVRDRPPDAFHRVVQHEPRADVRPLDDLPVQRVEERHRPHQVRREPGNQQVALPQRLPDQLEVALLQVAEAAVDQLATTGTRCPAARSRDSTRPTRSPRDAASSAAPAPVIPPPITSTSSGPAASALQRSVAGTRVKNTGHGRLLPPGSPGREALHSIVSTGNHLVTDGLPNPG